MGVVAFKQLVSASGRMRTPRVTARSTTVALLQNEPFEVIVEEQRKLEDLVRAKELPEDKKLRPRRAFTKPNDHLLDMIQAGTELRDNPSHKDLKELTVQFKRHG